MLAAEHLAGSLLDSFDVCFFIGSRPQSDQGLWIRKQLQAFYESKVSLIVRDKRHFQDQCSRSNQTIRNEEPMAQTIDPQQVNSPIGNQVAHFHDEELLQESLELSQLGSVPTTHHQLHLRDDAYSKR